MREILNIQITRGITIKNYNLSKIMLFLIITMLLLVCFSPISLTQKTNKNKNNGVLSINGKILFSPLNSETTYLMDATGQIINTWSSSYRPGLSVYYLDDGYILRAIRKTYLAPAGAGGGVQKISYDGDLIWDFNYYTDDYLSHHDIEPLPNGNVLILAWEYKTNQETINAGRDPDNIPTTSLMPDFIIEVEPTGFTSGNIVWEWHVWDHLIQDFDPNKDNYGNVENHPELIDINYGYATIDWLHINSIDYNEEFDQILLSVRNFDEIWVIDHSTTKAEAKGHSGGNSGKGGDILYRWGNPITYRAGNESDQKLFSQHDATWIESGCPGEGDILIFNNGNYRPDGRYSSVDEIVPPVDFNGFYNLEPGMAYGPEEFIWSYTADDPKDFFSNFLSGAQRLEDGNTLICDGPGGRFFEVNPNKEVIWEYTNPYPNPLSNYVFKISYITGETPNPEKPDLDCEGVLSWDSIIAGEMVSGYFYVKNVGNINSLLNWSIVEWPDWGTWNFEPMSGFNLSPQDDFFVVNVSVIAPEEKNTEFEGYIKIINQDDKEDFEVIYVYLKTPLNKESSRLKFIQFFIQFLNKLPFFNILQNFFKLL